MYAVWQKTVDLDHQKSKLHPTGDFPYFHEATLSRQSVQHCALPLFRDHLLELRYDLVPSRHHGLHFIFGEIMLGFSPQFVRV
jgi:hypothetical protein